MSTLTSNERPKLRQAIQDIIDHVLDVNNGQCDHEFAVRCELMWMEFDGGNETPSHETLTTSEAEVSYAQETGRFYYDGHGVTRDATAAEIAGAFQRLRDLQCEHESLLRGRMPTHRCKVCGAMWIDWGDSWSLFSPRCGQCCDNVAMGHQIEALPVLRPAVETNEHVPLREFLRYRQALYRANGFLIMRGLEPVKLEYPTDTSTSNQTVTSVSGATMTEQQIKHMVNRFLGWRLPENFQPDAGISFKAEYNVEYNAARGKPPMRYQPTGTNLFDAAQAEAMVRYLINGMPSEKACEGQS